MNDQVAGLGIELDEAGVVFFYDRHWFASGVGQRVVNHEPVGLVDQASQMGAS